jgi:hypothetical protein
MRQAERPILLDNIGNATQGSGASRGQLIMKWVARNKTWLFSGIGVFLLSGLLKIASQSTDSPSPARPDPVDVPRVVEEDRDKKVNVDDAENKIFLADYTKLFDGYLYYFVNSLKPNSVEHVIGDDLLKEMVARTISVNSHGDLHLTVSPVSHARIFGDQLKIFDFRDAVPPPDGRDEWEYGKNPVDERYYQIRDQISENLRTYFSDRRRLESFYRAKKHLAREAIREAIPIAFRSKFVGEIDRVIESFQVVLDPVYRRTFEGYLAAERRYIGERYGFGSDDIASNFHNTYNEHDRPVRFIYFAAVQEKSPAHAQEEELAEARKILFARSPNAKVAAFAYRRYLEGGEELVEGYVAILRDLKVSVFAD